MTRTVYEYKPEAKTYCTTQFAGEGNCVDSTKFVAKVPAAQTAKQTLNAVDNRLYPITYWGIIRFKRICQEKLRKTIYNLESHRG